MVPGLAQAHSGLKTQADLEVQPPLPQLTASGALS